MTRCIALTRAGKPCRAHARRGSDPPLCRSHLSLVERPAETLAVAVSAVLGEALPPAARAPQLTVRAPADSRATAAATRLEDEIAAVRAMLDRLSLHINEQPDLSTAELSRLAPLVFSGSRTISRLLRDRQALSGETADAFLEFINQVLDRLAEEMRVTL